ncbi:acyl-CoA synthetase [Cryobacterium melibiosiphilum]|uniref:Acyl-CoA synthetase n=1 Tax=Cryobacterium melibiosiphilum TaxID=995039 RepID=A0A3A5MIZ3_9MICO|nr:AMP-binding protein [Cryobacterium melibiosiphilum]RJT89015.1 acyl-CoA synthetase [Cryobacterium melibiosiphilum]
MALQQVALQQVELHAGAGLVSDARIPGLENLGQLICRAADTWGDRVAWRFDATGEALSFTQIEQVTRYLATRLAAAGIRSGDHVAVLATNTLEFPATWLALTRLGAVIVPLNVNYRTTDASHVVQHAGATTVLAIDALLPLAHAVAERCPTVQRVLPLTRLLADWRADPESVDTANIDPAVELDAAARDHTANIQYTSGTTGKPKGCILGHDYWLSIAYTMVHDFPHLTDTDVMLTVQPFHYIDPQWNVVSALLAGAELVILDRFHPSTFWQQVRSYSVTYFYCLGLMPTLLLKMPASADDTHNRVRAVQASAIPTALHRALEERWGVPWFEAYGMTETGADLYVDAPEHDELVGSGSMGRPRSHREARVVDAAGHPSAPDAVGQLQLRGAGLMRGYFADPAATEKAFTDGWFHTGDLASIDSAGRIYYRGRTKDMIRRSGENISAIEVEEVLGLHPRIELAAVVAVPDELRGEEVLAYLVAAPGPAEIPETAEELIESVRAGCAAELAYFKVPRFWRLVADLPRTVSERVAKHELAGPGALTGVWDAQEHRWHG